MQDDVSLSLNSPMSEVFIKLDAGAKMPSRGSDAAAGFDIYALNDTYLIPGETKLIHTGVYLAMPENLEAQVRPRSGLSLKSKLRIANAPGTIDADYRNEICVIAENAMALSDTAGIISQYPDLALQLNKTFHAINLGDFLYKQSKVILPVGFPDTIIYVDDNNLPLGTIFIKKGERIAQLVFQEVKTINFTRVSDVSGIGSDRGGGFGSTGK